MILSSHQARQTLRWLQHEIDRIAKQDGKVPGKKHARLMDLLIHRNLLRSVLAGRDMERDKKVVNLEMWRLGFASPGELARFGYRISGAPRPAIPDSGAPLPKGSRRPYG